MKIVIDVETTYQVVNGRTYPMPWHPDNKLVMFQWHKEDGTEGVIVLNHNEYAPTGYEKQGIQDILNQATLLIGHNIKFDMLWLKSCGFEINCPLYDTMIGEYIAAQGMKLDLSLAGSANRHGLTPKGDLLREYIKARVNVDAIPLDKLIEYGLGDVKTTFELYLAQTGKDSAITKLMNEFLPVIIDMELAGCHIDKPVLEQLRVDYTNEHRDLTQGLDNAIRDVMGATPVNINSNEQLSKVIYSREPKDKKQWARIFNIGSELRNSVYKVKYKPKLSEGAFKKIIREHTNKIYKTEAVKCDDCIGHGKIRKTRKDGTDYKKDTICKSCRGRGAIYRNTDKVGGFKVTPLDARYVGDGGFSCGKKIIAELLKSTKVKQNAKDFLTAYARHSAISSYLTSFIDGIANNLFTGSLLHTNFNQCITSTGRLSSSNPNFQNLPRDKTFPIRQVIKSRWENGSILDCDLAQVEFRVAAILSGCQTAKEAILSGEDVHSFTAKVLTDAGQPTDRQGAKSHTFKPLYGGLSGSDAERAYYESFLAKYVGVAKWHHELSEQAIRDKRVTSPSGRVYSFPNAARQKNGKSTQYTQIVNYCVQGFAGDIAQCVMIELHNLMKEAKLNSLLILTVHDSVTADVYPGEENVMIQVFKKAFDKIPEIMYNRFGVRTDVPIGYELSIGNNWANKKKVA